MAKGIWQYLREEEGKMQYANITVQYVNQSRNPRAPSGSLKDTSGGFWSVPKKHLGQFDSNGRHVQGTGLFQENQSYEIGFETTFGNDGRQYNNVQQINETPLDAVQPAPQAAPAQPQQAVPQRQPVPQKADLTKDKIIWVEVVAKALCERDATVSLADAVDQGIKAWNRQIKPWLDRGDMDNELEDEMPPFA